MTFKMEYPLDEEIKHRIAKLCTIDKMTKHRCRVCNKIFHECPDIIFLGELPVCRKCRGLNGN